MKPAKEIPGENQNNRGFKLSQEQIDFLEQERIDYLKGKGKLHSWEEAKQLIREKRSNRFKRKSEEPKQKIKL